MLLGSTCKLDIVNGCWVCNLSSEKIVALMTLLSGP